MDDILTLANKLSGVSLFTAICIAAIAHYRGKWQWTWVTDQRFHDLERRFDERTHDLERRLEEKTKECDRWQSHALRLMGHTDKAIDLAASATAVTRDVR